MMQFENQLYSQSYPAYNYGIPMQNINTEFPYQNINFTQPNFFGSYNQMTMNPFEFYNQFANMKIGTPIQPYNENDRNNNKSNNNNNIYEIQGRRSYKHKNYFNKSKYSKS